MVCFGGCGPLAAGCDSSLETSETLKMIDYELYHDITLKVTLDPNHVHESLIFDREEEYDNYGIDLEKTGEVTVNTHLWNELSHAFDPVEISMFDMDRSVIVSNIKYTADKEALYGINLENETSEPKLQVFYGESGEEDLKEIELVQLHRNKLEELSSYNFKNPDAKRLYSDFVENYSDSNVLRVSGDMRARCGPNSSSCDDLYYYFHAENGDPYEIKYRTTSTGTIQKAHIRWYIWNQSYRSGIRKRSRGGTITEIDRSLNQSWNEMPDNDSPIGPYHENGTPDNSKPWVFVKIITRETDKRENVNRWRIRVSGVKRGNGGTESRHSASIRLNNQNQSTLKMNDVYVP